MHGFSSSCSNGEFKKSLQHFRIYPLVNSTVHERIYTLWDWKTRQVCILQNGRGSKYSPELIRELALLRHLKLKYFLKKGTSNCTVNFLLGVNCPWSSLAFLHHTSPSSLNTCVHVVHMFAHSQAPGKRSADTRAGCSRANTRFSRLPTQPGRTPRAKDAPLQKGKVPNVTCYGSASVGGSVL